MTIQPGDPRAGHHQARNTQELLDAADRVGEQQQQRYSRDPSTDEIPVADGSQQAQATREPLDPRAQRHQESSVPEETSAQQSEPMVEPTANEHDADPTATEHDATQRGTFEQDATEHDGTERGTFERDTSELGTSEQGTSEQGAGHRAQNTNTDDEHVALFDPREAQELQSRWREVQTAFVDDPRSAVQGADQLVAQVIQSLTASFAAHKEELDGQWQNSDTSGPATEDLRLALRRYRTLFNQLLNT